ncbi:MAG: PIN domain-containing protein [Thioalkalivibrio sp.]|nr:PIN domain-containing protein [Thioalkalivibrio sp.]
MERSSKSWHAVGAPARARKNADELATLSLLPAHGGDQGALPDAGRQDRSLRWEDLTIVTSPVTLLEVLVVPYRAGNLALATRYEALRTRSRGVVPREIDRGQLRAAAQFRAVAGARTLDALQLAAALTGDAPHS